MSFGSLSKNVVFVLNKGVKLGGFYQNIGEGGLMLYYFENGGDIVWQIGMGYFGCRNKDGIFNLFIFQEKVCLLVVKMIEIKFSQGVKLGYGGILFVYKNIFEIVEICDVLVVIDVILFFIYSVFLIFVGLFEFVKILCELSGGKLVGFKLVIG